ncbi:hypothetical protein [Guggenheimella bovis]
MKVPYKELMDDIRLDDGVKRRLAQSLQSQEETMKPVGKKIEEKKRPFVKLFFGLASVAVIVLAVYLAENFQKPSGSPVASSVPSTESFKTEENVQSESEPVISKKFNIGYDAFIGEHVLTKPFTEETLKNSPFKGEDVPFKVLPAFKRDTNWTYETAIKRTEKIVEKLGWTKEKMSEKAFYETSNFIEVVCKEGTISSFPQNSVTLTFNEKPSDESWKAIQKKAGFNHMKELYVTSEAQEYQRAFYEDSSDSLTRLVNYTQMNLIDIGEAGGTWFAEYTYTDNDENLGEFPILSPKEAKEELLKGKAFSTNLTHPKDLEILGMELLYGTDGEGYVLPYYHFFLKSDVIDGTPYAFDYYVPAFKPDYYTGASGKNEWVMKENLPDFEGVESVSVLDNETNKTVELKVEDIGYLKSFIMDTQITAYPSRKTTADEHAQRFQITLKKKGSETIMTFPQYSIQYDGYTSEAYDIDNGDLYTLIFIELLQSNQ